MQLAEQDGPPQNQARCHNYLGVALRIMGSLDEALEHHRRAFELLEPLSEAQLEIDFLHTYADTCRAAGLYDEALALHERTIELARKLGRPHDEKLAREAYQATAGNATRPEQPAASPPGAPTDAVWTADMANAGHRIGEP